MLLRYYGIFEYYTTIGGKDNEECNGPGVDSLMDYTYARKLLTGQTKGLNTGHNGLLCLWTAYYSQKTGRLHLTRSVAKCGRQSSYNPTRLKLPSDQIYYQWSIEWSLSLSDPGAQTINPKLALIPQVVMKVFTG